jgi:hypothetical protein
LFVDNDVRTLGELCEDLRHMFGQIPGFGDDRLASCLRGKLPAILPYSCGIALFQNVSGIVEHADTDPCDADIVARFDMDAAITALDAVDDRCFEPVRQGEVVGGFPVWGAGCPTGIAGGFFESLAVRLLFGAGLPAARERCAADDGGAVGSLAEDQVADAAAKGVEELVEANFWHSVGCPSRYFHIEPGVDLA